jgi:hypothetical protein
MHKVMCIILAMGKPTPPLWDILASLSTFDDDPYVQSLPDAARRALMRLWQMAMPFDGLVSEPTMRRVLRSYAGGGEQEAPDALLDAGLVMLDGAWADEPPEYQLLTPAQRDSAWIFSESEADVQSQAEVDEIWAREVG